MRSIPSRRVQNSWLVGLAVALGACQTPSDPPLETPADSLAQRLVDASGGHAAWAALPALRFDWVVQTDSAELVRVRHLWDRAGDRARVEWSAGQDSTLVAVMAPGVFDPGSPAGSAALTVSDGPPEVLSGDAALDALRDAHARWVNDTYWMIAPVKTFDPGVDRALAPDSGAATLALSFGRVGLTPGDRYWLRLGDDGAMEGWTYVLEGDSAATRWTWTDPRTVSGPRGDVTVWATKRKDGEPVEIVTRPLRVPAFDDATFADLAPRLAGSE